MRTAGTTLADATEERIATKGPSVSELTCNKFDGSAQL